MKKMHYIFIVLPFFMLGCSSVTEGVKKFAGTSTQHLEEARIDAQTRTYVCGLDDCFNAVLSLARDKKDLKPNTEKFFDTFIVKRDEGVLVVMGIEGNVDTTEVGLFFTTDGSRMTKIEITSLSSSARRKVAEAVFKELDSLFSEKKVF